MSRPTAISTRRYFPAVLGLGSFAAFVLLVELLVFADVFNRFIIPPPSDVLAAFPRVATLSLPVSAIALAFR